MTTEKALIAMSGGVDSSAAAYLTSQAGYSCIGATMKLFDNAILHTGESTCCSVDDVEDARAVADLIEANFPKLNGKVLINSVGTTIGSHTGPGTVALFFWGKERTP